MQDTIDEGTPAAVVPHTGGGTNQYTAPPTGPPRRSRLRWVIAAIAVLAAVAAFVANRDGGPRDTVSYVTEAARTADLEDVVEATATLAFDTGAETAVRTTLPGVVTDVAVAAGDTPASLAPVVAVDGSDLYALPGDTPAHRPLGDGDEGPDVLTLEAALAAAGYDPGEVDDVFDTDTDAALREFQEEVGLDESGTFDPTHFLWLPTGAEVLAVDVALGDRLTGVEPLFVTGVPDQVVAEATVDQTDVVDVTVDDPVTLDIDGLEPFEGTVDRIAASSVGGDATYLVRITTSDLPAAARVGMTGDAEIVTAVIADVVVVPTGVIGGTAAQPTVPVLVDGEPVDRPVELGLVTASQVEVVSGVEAGDAIVLGEDG